MAIRSKVSVIALGLAIVAAAASLAVAARGARADRPPALEVDVALVLAVDVSGSISDNSWRLQRDGIADAIGSPRFAQSVTGGALGRIAIAVMQWGSDARLVLGWRTLMGGGDALALAAEIRGLSRVESGSTCMEKALAAAVVALAPWDALATRRVIDVSGDGHANCNGDVAGARTLALASGLTINGLPIITPTEPLIEDWYRSNVIGGPGAFIVPADGYPAFAEAFLKKLTNEIAEARR